MQKLKDIIKTVGEIKEMKQLLSGNEAIAHGAWEAGITVASAYPGTPSTEILENLSRYDEPYCEWAPNEKVALEVTIGASIAGLRSMAVMKHVGLNVAADPLFTLAYTGVNGGLIIISADDPGMHSSQNEQDNRYYAKFAKIPMLEPSDSQEARDYVHEAIRISEEYKTPVLLRVTTRISHSKSVVEVTDERNTNAIPYKKNIRQFVCTPANSRKLHVELEERLQKLAELSNKSGLNKIEWNNKKTGIVTSGISYQYAKAVFEDNASYFKVGMTYPLPLEGIKDFAEQVETLYVIEELEPFMEEQMLAAGINCIGKAKLPRVGEFSPDLISKYLLGKETPKLQANPEKVVERPPIMCPGCPHRGVFYLLSKEKNIMITGDIGCYTLGSAAPLQAMDTCICMGASISAGHGGQIAFKKQESNMRVVSVIGDSTFFHSGITGLMNVLYNKNNTLTIILDNRTTGMTGHQDNPGTGYTLKSEETIAIDILNLCKELGIENVCQVNPLNLKETKEAIKAGLSSDKPSVIVAKWPCALKKASDLDIKEFNLSTKKYHVLQDKCRSCYRCISCGCPALRVEGTVVIDTDTCNGCGVCAQICPFDAICEVNS
jgi:indolepyruvate ferredoxin oxidoreductase alpha subunit